MYNRPIYRRDFIKGLGLLCLPIKPAFAKPGIHINAPKEICQNLRINSGPFAGGFQVAPNGMLHWYFTNLGLLGIITTLNKNELQAYIRPYLNLYLHHMKPNFTISDIDLHHNYTPKEPDSHDSYAATFISLACAYILRSGDQPWFEEHASQLSQIVEKNILHSQKNNGLIAVFQPGPNAASDVGYFMDGCEVYAGLRDFELLLLRQGRQSQSQYYAIARQKLVTGLKNLYSVRDKGFAPSDSDRPETTFYPGATCQIFPQVFGVYELSNFYNRGWVYFKKYAPRWALCQHDDYPWAMTGYAAALRGLKSQAQDQIRTIDSIFISNREKVLINELGFYWKTLHLI